jgi:hypothetical protein
MRLEGFEPPTNGLEGRRSSAELQARDLKGTARLAQVLVPKSAVTIVTGPPRNVPGAAAK